MKNVKLKNQRLLNAFDYVAFGVKQNLVSSKKEPFYNKFLAWCRASGIQYETLSTNTIWVKTGHLKNYMFRPKGCYCRVYLPGSFYNWDIYVNHSVDRLLQRMYEHNLITLKELNELNLIDY